MSQKIASRARRRVLIAGAGALGVPIFGLPLLGVSPASHAAGASYRPLHTGLMLQAPAAQAGGKLVLSGRLTDARGAAITGAAIELRGIDLTAVSDADGRFLLVASAPAVPAAGPIELQVTTRSGQMLRRLVQPTGEAGDAGVLQFSDAPNATLASAPQRVWRASVDLSLFA